MEECCRQSLGKGPKAGACQDLRSETRTVGKESASGEKTEMKSESKGENRPTGSFEATVRTLVPLMSLNGSYGKVLGRGLDLVPLDFSLSQVGFPP